MTMLPIEKTWDYVFEKNFVLEYGIATKQHILKK